MNLFASPQLKKTFLYGTLFGLIIAIYSFFLYSFHLEDNVSLGWLKIVIFIVTVIISVSCYRNRICNGSITFGNAFGTGFLTLLWGAMVIFIYTFIYLKYFNQDMLEQMKVVAIEDAERKYEGDMQVQLINLIKKIFTPFTISLIKFIGNLIWGAIISLVVAAVYQKNNINSEN